MIPVMTNRGTAYILYDHPSGSESAIAHMHEAQLDGAVITVSIVITRRAFSRSPPPARPARGWSTSDEKWPLHQEAHHRTDTEARHQEEAALGVVAVMQTMISMYHRRAHDTHDHPAQLDEDEDRHRTLDHHLEHPEGEEVHRREVHHDEDVGHQVTAAIAATAGVGPDREADLGRGIDMEGRR